jgi:hypothetical protein
MQAFELSLSKPLHRARSVPVGYAVGLARFGDFQEQFWSSLSVWSRNQYKRQWKTAARRCFEQRSPTLFYTDVTARSATAFHAVPTATGILFFQQIFRGRGTPLSRPMGAHALLRDREQLSSWTVPFDALRALAYAT